MLYRAVLDRQQRRKDVALVQEPNNDHRQLLLFQLICSGGIDGRSVAESKLMTDGKGHLFVEFMKMEQTILYFIYSVAVVGEKTKNLKNQILE